MAIVKVSKSGKAVLFVDDEGNVFITSTAYLKGLLNKGFKGFNVLTRLPNKALIGAELKSPVWGVASEGDGFAKKKADKDVGLVKDLLEF